jgi:hypothetical protein
MSGLQADARSMIEHARVESQNHAFNYAEPLRVESCTQAICDLALRFGEGAEGEESIMSRPFGVALLIAGYDEDGPSLYVDLPSPPILHLAHRTNTKQLPRRTLRHILPLRRQSHWLRLRGRASRTPERIPQVAYPPRGRGAHAQDAQAGHGGEAG